MRIAGVVLLLGEFAKHRRGSLRTERRLQVVQGGNFLHLEQITEHGGIKLRCSRSD